jgi:ABC-type transport system substrate-binding protein
MVRALSTAVIALTAMLSSSMSTSFAAGKETVYQPKKSSYEKLTAKKGGTYLDTLSNNPKVINPIVSADANSSSLEPFIWATLFTEDPDNFNPLPYLAESYKISADKKTYTFVLNKAAKWQDGTPVTTADVKFTFETMMNPKVDAAAIRSYWEGVSLEVVDGLTFKFKNENPKFDTLRFLYSLAVVQASQFKNESDFNKAKGIMQPVGNGPYKLKTFSRDQKIELERVQDWWASSLPQFKNRFNADLIVFRIITDATLEYERFVRGDQDIMSFGANAYEIYANKVKGTDKNRFGSSPNDGKDIWTQEFKNKAARGFSYVGWNLRQKMFQGKKTRQALARLADYQQIIDKVMYGYAYQSTSPFGSLTMNSDPSLRLASKMMTFNRTNALKLLKEDGWADTNKNGTLDKMLDGKLTEFKFTIKYNSNNPARGKIAQILRENFKSAGIDMEIRAMEWNAYLTDIDNRNFDAFILAWTGSSFPNPKQIWHSESEKDQGSNTVAFSNKRVDQLIDQANVEFDMAKRAKILQQINAIIYDEQPYMFLLEGRSLLAAFNKKVKSQTWVMNYDVGPPSDIYSFAP